MFATGIGFIYSIEDYVTLFGFVVHNFGIKLVMLQHEDTADKKLI
jgi:hypothetical protein